MNPDSPLDALTGLLTPSDQSGELGPPDAIPGLQDAGESPALPEVVLAVPGAPVPWAPKVTNRNTGNRFLPNRQAEAIGRIIDAVQRAELERFAPRIPLLMACEFYVQRPKAHCGTGRNEGVLKDRFRHARPVGKPDLTNLVKLIEDGIVLAGLVPDDDQIVGVYPPFGKWYAPPGDQPRSVIRIRRA